MATNVPFLSISHMQIWLSRQASSPTAVTMEHLSAESSHEYLMRWTTFHHIQLDFHMENYSANTMVNPIVCVPTVGGVHLRCSSGNGANITAAREAACKRFVDTYGCVIQVGFAFIVAPLSIFYSQHATGYMVCEVINFPTQNSFGFLQK
ncbi:hypothetical protein BDV93DRAFT_506727 [Ceratobasidium sp. AG-I]|nr:hypothetical protein BDV93DRAFT_506727 [Ceratobasidium sp. AG-I]